MEAAQPGGACESGAAAMRTVVLPTTRAESKLRCLHPAVRIACLFLFPRSNNSSSAMLIIDKRRRVWHRVLYGPDTSNPHPLGWMVLPRTIGSTQSNQHPLDLTALLYRARRVKQRVPGLPS